MLEAWRQMPFHRVRAAVLEGAWDPRHGVDFQEVSLYLAMRRHDVQVNSPFPMFALFAEPGPVLPKGSELHQFVVSDSRVSLLFCLLLAAAVGVSSGNVGLFARCLAYCRRRYDWIAPLEVSLFGCLVS